MRMTCPACGATTSLDALLGHEAARSALVQALEQTPAGRRLVRYIALFRPAERALSWDRTANLLGELLDMMKAARVERHGRLWAAPEGVWIAALDEILAQRDAGKLRTPLKSHGYLLEIIAGQADKTEAKAETQAEERKLHASRARGLAPEPVASREVAAAALEKAKQQLKGGKHGNAE